MITLFYADLFLGCWVPFLIIVSPMGTNCAPFISALILNLHERQMLSLQMVLDSFILNLRLPLQMNTSS